MYASTDRQAAPRGISTFPCFFFLTLPYNPLMGCTRHSFFLSILLRLFCARGSCARGWGGVAGKATKQKSNEITMVRRPKKIYV
jgi:hypothetical protein